MKVVILCLLFFIPTTLAEDKGIFYILDEKFINNISEIPDSAGTPDKQIQTSGNIQAWVDIVGFRSMIREDGIDYVPGNSADYAIVQYDTTADRLKSRAVPYFTGNCYWCHVSSINEWVEVFQEGNETIARLHVTLKWYEVVENSGSSQTIFYTESATFDDKEPAPETYPPLQEDLRVNLTQYNNSLYENIGIRIVNISGLNKYTIQYEDNIAIYQIKKAHVEQTAKGIYFANVTPAEILELKGKNISRYGKIILLNGNLSKMSPGDIKITGSNLYETRTANSSQFNITRLEFKPEKELENPVSMWFISVMAVTAGGIYFYARRMMDQWLRNT